MASGSSDDSENPVPLNVTPMIDIIFCLIIFFMCSFHFKALEGKFDSWLPKEKGPNPSPVVPPVLEEIRVLLSFDEPTRGVVTRMGARAVDSQAELGSLLAAARLDYESLGKRDVPAIIDAEPRVPWTAVVRTMDACRASGLRRVEFAAPMPGR